MTDNDADTAADLRRQLGAQAHIAQPHEQSTWLGYKVPADPYYPEDSVQCDACGGTAVDDLELADCCPYCNGRGWLPDKEHPHGRRCANISCNKPLHPAKLAVYCCNNCAMDDA